MDTKKLRQKILDLAIRGKLVKQDANEEPANVLLARIRKEKERLVKEGKLKKKDLVTTPVSDEDKPFGVPEGWEWCRIKDVCSKIVDGDHNPPKGEKSPTGYYMLSSKNINNNTIVDKEDCRHLSYKNWSLCNSRTQLQRGDILLTTVASLGRSCILEENTPYCFQRSVTVFTTLIYNYYLKYVFDSSYYQIHMEKNARGTAQKGFYLNQVETSLIPLPPLSEQQRIVAEVEKWMSLIDTIENGQENLLQSIATAKSKILTLAVNGKLLEKEGDWEEKTLGEICDYGKCTSITVDEIKEDAWVLELEDIEKDSAKLLNRLSKKERKIKGTRHKFNKGDVLYSKLRTYLNKVLVADCNGYCTTEIIPISCPNIILPKFLCNVMRSKPFIDYTIQCGYGVKMPRLSTSDAKKAIIPLPPLSEQQRIVTKIEQIFAQLDSIAAAIKS